MNRENRLLNRRAFLWAAASGTGMVLLAACGGNQAANTSTAQPNGVSTQAGANTNTPATRGGANTTTPIPPPYAGQTTTAASPASTSVTASSASTVTGSTQAPIPTVSAQNFKESPDLTKQVNAGKLPSVEKRLPSTPLVVKPIERVGRYGGDWRTVLQGPADSVWLTRTIGYECLVRWDPKWERIIPNIAASFDVNEDATKYTFKLREGMKWSDGKPFTADDILFWYEDVWTNKNITPSPSSRLINADNPVKLSKTDDYTVVFKFSRSYGLFLANLAAGWGEGPNGYPAHYLKQFHKKYNPDVVKEAKKQKLDSWVDLFGQKASDWDNPDKPTLFGWKPTTPLGKSTTQYVAERNPYYWKVDSEGNQLPYLDRVVYQIVEKPDVMVLKALNGELDMQDRHINDLSNKPLFFKNQKKGNFHFYEIVGSSMNTMMLALNLTTRNKNLQKTFNDLNFRIGLSHAIDRQDIIDVVYVSQGQPWQGAPRPQAKKFGIYNDQLAKQYLEHDPNKASEYLDKALPKKARRASDWRRTVNPLHSR